MAPRIRKTKTASSAASSATSTESAKTTAPAAAAASTTASTPLVLLDMPPPNANIPAPPSGFVAGDTADYRSVLPRDAELRALPIAVKDMTKFTDYTQILGQTAPPYAEMMQALTVANAWSSMRTESAAWDAFCGSQEGISWTTLRGQMERLQPSFDLATGGTSNVTTLYPGLATLLDAKKVIARKGASTRKMNKEAEAKGETPVHGRVGKARQRKAEKAAYAATNAPAAAGAAVTGTTPTQSAGGAAAGSAGAGTAAAAPVASAPQAAAATNGAAVTNGTGH